MTPLILVLGGEGMLGHKMFQLLRARYPNVRATLRGRKSDWPRVALLQGGDVLEDVDVLRHDCVRSLLAALRPSVVVNCVGIIKQRAAAAEAIPSITINALLPHQLAAWLEPWGGRLIHFSTDCVFSGRRGGYTEDDEPDAVDLYGRTKSLGEIRPLGEIRALNALTLRTSIIGRELAEHRSLLDWFLRQERRSVRGFTRVLYSGVTTNHLSEIVGDVIERHPALTGLYQVTGRTISKYDLLVHIRDAFGLTTRVEPDDTEVSDRSMFGERFCQATGYVPPPWPALLAALAADPTPYEEWTR